MKKTAILLGATGLTGGLLLELLLKDGRYEKIKLFSRKSMGISHPKIEEHIVDLFQLEKQKNHFKANEVFCCIGTTRAKTPDVEVYKKIDYAIPVTAARLCKENNINTFIVISAVGANPDSRFFYNKTKGKMERDVLAQNIRNTVILQPGLIDGGRDEKRLGEWMARYLFKILNPILPKKYQSVTPQSIAKAMLTAANEGCADKRIENDMIKKIAKHAGN